MRRFFSFPVMLAWSLAVVTVLTVCNRFNDPDLWFHLKLGQIMWNTHTIPSSDLLSFTTHGHFWIAHEWLAEVAIYAAYRLGGYTGLMWFLAGLSSLLVGLIYVLCYQRCGNALASFLGGLSGWFFATVGFGIRPQLLGYLFLVVELVLLQLASRNRRWLWLMPPLFGVWVNCHGSYFFGMGVLFVYWLCTFAKGKWATVFAAEEEQGARTTLAMVLLLSLVAVCCNPIGISLPLYPLNFAFLQSTNISSVTEWLPPDLQDGRTLGMIAALVAIPAISLLRRVEIPLRDVLVLAAASAMALQHSRMLIVFGIAVSPMLTEMLSSVLGKDRGRDHPIANALLIGVFLTVIAWQFPTPAELQRQVVKESPAGAVDYIRQAKLAGPMLNEYVFGGYLIWALPEEKVFIDGRCDVFDWTGVLQEYGRWATLVEDPSILLEKYKIKYCLISKNAPMGHVLPYLPGWRKVYSDEVSSIFAR